MSKGCQVLAVVSNSFQFCSFLPSLPEEKQNSLCLLLGHGCLFTQMQPWWMSWIEEIQNKTKPPQTWEKVKIRIYITSEIKVRSHRFKNLMRKQNLKKNLLGLRETSKNNLPLSPGYILWTLGICVPLWTLNIRPTFHFLLPSPSEGVLCDEHSPVPGSYDVMWLSVTLFTCPGQSLPPFTSGTLGLFEI